LADGNWDGKWQMAVGANVRVPASAPTAYCPLPSQLPTAHCQLPYTNTNELHRAHVQYSSSSGPVFLRANTTVAHFGQVAKPMTPPFMRFMRETLSIPLIAWVSSARQFGQ